MSHVVHQLVLHPAVSASLKVGATNVGRDKLYRTIQYAARFLAWYCLHKGYSNETVAKLTALKSQLALSRKLMRIGKPLEHLQAAIKTLDVSDPFLKLTAAGRQLGYAAYLFNDMLVWLHTARVRPFTGPTIAKINQRAARFWFWGIVFSLASGTYKQVGLKSKIERLQRGGADEKKVELRAALQQQSAVRTQLLQDSLDILLPAGTLGYHNLDDGILGIVGTITSLMGLRAQIDKVLK